VTSPISLYRTASALRWRPACGASTDSIVLDPAQIFQDILGSGSSFTNSAGNVLNQLPDEVRGNLLYELFHPSEMGSASRGCALARATMPRKRTVSTKVNPISN
jgi:hypothetical protein